MKYIEEAEIVKKGFLGDLCRRYRYIQSWLTRMLCLCQPSTQSSKAQKTYTFSICAIFRNEGPFLKEWIEFHTLIGVDHFYLYNNFSEDNYLEILQPYIESGLVTLTDWPVEYGQLSAYLDCFNKHKEETQWIAYIDLDEFICLTKDTDIKAWINSYRNYPTVYINWKVFGASGVMEHDKKQLVVEQYTAAWGSLSNMGKSFINTRFNFQSIGCHFSYLTVRVCGLSSLILPVNEFKKSFRHWVCRAPKRKESCIQLNHYIYRSYAQYLYKTFKRPDAISLACGELRKQKGLFEFFETHCTVHDYTIQRFLTLLKRCMKA